MQTGSQGEYKVKKTEFLLRLDDDSFGSVGFWYVCCWIPIFFTANYFRPNQLRSVWKTCSSGRHVLDVVPMLQLVMGGFLGCIRPLWSCVSEGFVGCSGTFSIFCLLRCFVYPRSVEEPLEYLESPCGSFCWAWTPFSFAYLNYRVLGHSLCDVRSVFVPGGLLSSGFLVPIHLSSVGWSWAMAGCGAALLGKSLLFSKWAFAKFPFKRRNWWYFSLVIGVYYI